VPNKAILHPHVADELTLYVNLRAHSDSQFGVIQVLWGIKLITDPPIRLSLFDSEDGEL